MNAHLSTVHNNNSTKVDLGLLFTENITTLKTTLKNIQEIMKTLEEADTENHPMMEEES